MIYVKLLRARRHLITLQHHGWSARMAKDALKADPVGEMLPSLVTGRVNVFAHELTRIANVLASVGEPPDGLDEEQVKTWKRNFKRARKTAETALKELAA